MTIGELEQILNNLMSSQPMIAYGENGIMISNMLAILNDLQTIGHVLRSDSINDAFKMNFSAKMSEVENVFVMLSSQRLMERGINIGMNGMMAPPMGMQPPMGGVYSPMPQPQMFQPQPQYMPQQMPAMPQPVPQRPAPAPLPPSPAPAPAPAPAAPPATPAAPQPASEPKSGGGGGDGEVFMGFGGGGGNDGPSGGPAAGRDYLLKLLEK